MKNILIVEDQFETARLLEVILRGEGRTLLFAEKGEQALLLAREKRPEIILLDVMMPGGMDGFETARRLKADPATSSGYIVMMTARTGEKDRREVFASGADDLVTKPFDVLELKRKVEGLLNGGGGQS